MIRESLFAERIEPIYKDVVEKGGVRPADIDPMGVDVFPRSMRYVPAVKLSDVYKHYRKYFKIDDRFLLERIPQKISFYGRPGSFHRVDFEYPYGFFVYDKTNLYQKDAAGYIVSKKQFAESDWKVCEKSFDELYRVFIEGVFPAFSSFDSFSYQPENEAEYDEENI